MDALRTYTKHLFWTCLGSSLNNSSHSIPLRSGIDKSSKISLGDAFLIGFLSALIGTVIAALYNYINLTLINPEQLEVVREMMEESMESVEEEVQGVVSFFTNFATNPTMQFFSTLVMGAIFNAIIAIIVAAIMKKD